jgi:hypothetical protein
VNISWWIGLKFKSPLLLYPIPYFRYSVEPDIDILKARWKEIVYFLGYHTKGTKTYPMVYDLREKFFATQKDAEEYIVQ